MLKHLAILFTVFAVSAGSAKTYQFGSVTPAVTQPRVLYSYKIRGSDLLGIQNPRHNTYGEYTSRYGIQDRNVGANRLSGNPSGYFPNYEANRNRNRYYLSHGYSRNQGGHRLENSLHEGFGGNSRILSGGLGRSGFMGFNRVFSDGGRRRGFYDFNNGNFIRGGPTRNEVSGSNEFSRENFFGGFSNEGSNELGRGFFGRFRNGDSGSREFSRKSFREFRNKNSGSSELSRESFFRGFRNENSGSNEFSRERNGRFSNENSGSSEFLRGLSFRGFNNENSGSNEFSRESNGRFSNENSGSSEFLRGLSFHGFNNENSGSNEFSRESNSRFSSENSGSSESNRESSSEFIRGSSFRRFSSGDSDSNEYSDENISDEFRYRLQRERANRRRFLRVPIFVRRRSGRRLIGYIYFRKSSRGFTGGRFISLRALRRQFSRRESSEENSFEDSDENSSEESDENSSEESDDNSSEESDENSFSSSTEDSVEGFSDERRTGSSDFQRGVLVNSFVHSNIPYHIFNIGGNQRYRSNAVNTLGIIRKNPGFGGTIRQGSPVRKLIGGNVERGKINVNRDSRTEFNNGRVNIKASDFKGAGGLGGVVNGGAKGVIFSDEENDSKGDDFGNESKEGNASLSGDDNEREHDGDGEENGTDENGDDNINGGTTKGETASDDNGGDGRDEAEDGPNNDNELAENEASEGSEIGISNKKKGGGKASETENNADFKNKN